MPWEIDLGPAHPQGVEKIEMLPQDLLHIDFRLILDSAPHEVYLGASRHASTDRDSHLPRRNFRLGARFGPAYAGAMR